MKLFPDMKTIFPMKSEHGIAKIDHVEVSILGSLQSSQDGPEAYCPPGTYCRLIVGNTLMMSDTRMERNTNAEFAREARGHVLIAGLGLGMILHPILAKPEVLSVTVIEKCADVILLVSPTVQSDKLTIIEAYIYEWKPSKGTKYDCIYFDIWSCQSTETLEDMKKLHYRFRSYKAKYGWMDSWRRKTIKNAWRRENRMKTLRIW